MKTQWCDVLMGFVFGVLITMTFYPFVLVWVLGE